MSIKILLVDMDSKIPNLALMKISSYHKSIGDNVEIRCLNYDYYPHKKNCVIYTDEYSIVYVSTIFKNNVNRVKLFGSAQVFFGGVGQSLVTNLPPKMEFQQLDYSIYPDNNISYGFLTRGCIRNCYFCVVPRKEGMIHRDCSVDDVVKHKKVKFLDNNILAFNGHKEIFEELIEKKIKCQFNQGLDIRLLNETNAKLLSKLSYCGEYFFAFDNLKDEIIIKDKLELFKKYVPKDWKVKMFLYCNPNMNIYNNVIYRVKWCKNNKVLPYLMRDQSCWESEHSNFYIDLCAWCNQPSLFKKMTFEEFIKKRTKNIQRQEESIAIWKNKQIDELQ